MRDADAPRRTADAELASVPDNILSDTECDVKRQLSVNPAENGQQAAAEPVAEQKPEDTPERMELPAKARSYLEGAERKLLADMGEKMFVPRFARREALKPVL